MGDAAEILNGTDQEPIEDKDFEAIEQAVMASDKGRWFLREFGRRVRATDTDRLLAGIEKLYALTSRIEERPRPDNVHRELTEMRNELQKTRYRIAALRDEAKKRADDPAVTSYRAAADMGAAAQRLQVISQAFRQRVMNADLCDEMDSHVSAIFMSRSYQDLIAQRVDVLSEGLKEFEDRLSRLLDWWIANEA